MTEPNPLIKLPTYVGEKTNNECCTFVIELKTHGIYVLLHSSDAKTGNMMTLHPSNPQHRIFNEVDANPFGNIFRKYQIDGRLLLENFSNLYVYTLLGNQGCLLYIHKDMEYEITPLTRELQQALQLPESIKSPEIDIIDGEEVSRDKGVQFAHDDRIIKPRINYSSETNKLNLELFKEDDKKVIMTHPVEWSNGFPDKKDNIRLSKSSAV